jgi:hypothetical protein
MHQDKPKTALDMIHIAETKFTALIRSRIKNILQEFESELKPQEISKTAYKIIFLTTALSEANT